MNTIVEHINSAGHIFVEFALPMLIQSSVLIVILLLADLLLRKKVKAVFRYWIWMLVLAKLVLPTSLSSPLSLGYWFGDKLMYVTESEMGVETEAEAVEPAPTDMLPIINIVPIEVSRHTPAVLPMIPGAEPVTAEPAGPPVTPVTWQGVVFLLWLAVVIAMGLLLLQRAIFVRGLVAQAKEANRLMNDALVYCCERMGMKGKVGLKVSANATSPSVCGLIRPVILLPRNLPSSLGAGRLRAVLMHELAHIKRGDLWVNLVQTVLQIIYFYNPLLWLANCVIRRVREQAVDEAVLVAMGEKAKQYPQTLVSVAKLAFKQPALSLRLIGVVESKSALAGRIKHILGRPIPKSAKLGVLGVLAVIIAGAILLPMAKGEREKDISNPVSLDENGKPIVTHTLYMWGQKEEPIYQLEGKTYRNVGKVVARIGELMKQDPFPYIRVCTTKEFQRQQEPIENLSKRCRSIGFINMEFKYDLLIPPGTYQATLPNGVTVELVGLCEHPSEGKKWWKPDGDELLEAPYDEIGGNVYPDGDEKSFEFAIILGNLPAEQVNTKVRCEESVGGSAGGSSSPQKNGEYLSDFRWLATTFPKKLKACTVKVGVAAGQWQPVAESNGKGFGSRGSELGGVSFTKAFEVEDGISITVADDILGRPCRVVAITNDGEVVKPVRSSASSAGKVRQTTAKFNNVSLSEIKEFQFQTRPYEWVEFKNVSLRPGHNTDVQVEVEKPEDIFVATLPMARAERGSITEINTNPEADQQQRVRELVYVLRHMPTVFSGFDQWVAAIKELVEIGKPAVPELVAELDRTERDLTMRAIGYTLRAITDPRAVPVLIRTLPKAPVRTSDCALQIGDRELRKFMMEHHIDTTKPSKVVDYGRAVREITAALEKITGHSEGYEHYREPESEDLEDVGAVRNLREEAAKRWQIWWAKHWSELVTGEQLGSVTITPRQGDPVDEAGRSNFGPNFLKVDGRAPLSEEDAIDSAENQAGKLFAVRLHSGITVELVGISYNPSWNQPWWKPDGSTLETAPYDRMNGKGKSDEEQQCYEFAIHLSDLPETRVDTKWKFIPSVSPFGGGYPWRGDKQRRSYRVRAVKLPRSQETTTLRFGIASGKWNTFQVFKNMGSYGDGPNGIIVSRPVTASKDRVTIGVTHNMTDRATRVVAIDHTGNIRLSSGGFRHGPSGLQQIEARFSGLLQDEVKEFRFETRPYEWVTFKNVSLQPGIKPDVQVEGEYDNNLYQKQGSIRYALEFIGTPEELIDTTFVSKHGQLANPRQLEFANKLFRIRKSKDVDAFISLLSDGTKEQLNDGNNRRMLHNRIKKIKEGTFLRGQYDFKFFATFREFTDEDWDKLKEHVSFAEPPTHAIVYYHFHKGMSLGSTFYLIEDNGSYKFVAQTLLSDPIIPAKKEQPTGPKEYGIVAFKQTDNAYAQPAVWKYHWNIELSPEVSEKNTFQILKTTKVVSGQADLHPEIAAQKIIDESMIEKHKYDILKCRFYVDNSEPRYNYHQYGRKLSGWLCGLSIANTSKSTSMLFPGKDVTNVKPNKQGNFIGSDLELISFETSEENIRYEHKVILRKDDSPEAKSAALLRLEQMTRRRISNKKLQYLDRILTAYANDHNSEYPDRLDQIKSYDTDEWLDWLLENIEYLGKGKTLTETSKTVIAYDKTLLEKAGSTNVLFNEGPVQYCNPNWLKKIGITGVQKSDVQVERIEPRALDISKTVTGIATDKLGRLRGNVYIAPQSTSIWKGIRSDTQGRFTLEDVTPEQKKWVAYSQPSQAMGLFTIPENYTGQPIHVILNFREAEVEGRVVDPDGKGLADRKVELIVKTKQGSTYSFPCYRKTDQYGNYDSSIPCGSGLSIQARLADANQIEQKYVTKAIALSDNQIFEAMPTLVIGEGQPEQTDDGKVLYSGRVVNEQGDPIQGVEVQMMYKWRGSMGVWGKEVMTDEQGRWKRRLPKDLSNLRIGLLHPEYIEQSGHRASSAELLNGTNVMVMKQGLWLRGVVKNQQGEPIENALVDTGGGEGTTPYGEVIENCTTPRTLADGSFSIGGLAAGSKDIVVSAVGYAPRVVSVEVEDGMEPIEVSLKSGTTYVGQVVDVDGNPVERVKIDVGDWRVGKRRSSITRMTETDSQGLFKIEDLPEEGKLRFDFGKRGSGFQGFSKEMPEDLSHRDKIVMYKTPVFVGKVIDAETEEPITSFEVVNGVKWKSVDESFHWSRHYKKQVNSEDGAFSETWSGYHITYPFDGASCLKIEAKGYLPEITPPIKLGGKYEPFVIRLTKAEPWEGIVVDREGRPAVKAEVGWVGPDKKAFIKNGRFDATGWVAQAEVIVETNENGQFELNPTREEGLMVVVHSDGYAHVKSNDFKSGSRIQLIPWAKIEGTIASADTKSREFVVAVNPIISSEDYESQPIRWLFDRTSFSDKHFIIDHVPSIPLQVGQVVRWEQSNPVYIKPQPGEAYKVQIGGRGRTITGKIIHPIPERARETGEAGMSNPRRLHAAAYCIEPESKLPDEIRDMSERSFLWLWRDATNVYERSKTFDRRFIANIEDNGTFRFDNMPPGEYEFVVNYHAPLGENVSCGRGVFEAVAITRFKVDTDDTRPIHLPDIRMNLLTYPEVGDPASLFEARSLDGKVIRLEDFRGKVVLLDFWATWCRPCLDQMPKLKKIYEAFAANPRFAMIGMSVDWDLDKAKRFVADNGLQWPHACLGDMSESLIVKQYGVGAIPTAILIGGDGKIIARDLRAEEIKSAVAKALGTGSASNKRPDVQVEVEKPHSTKAVAKQGRKVYLPDLYVSKKILDLASGKLVAYPLFGEPLEKVRKAIREKGKGDLFYARNALVFLRGSQPDQYETIKESGVPCKIYRIGESFPQTITVTTKEGRKYKVKILSADEKGCQLEYYQEGGRRSTGRKPHVEVETKSDRTIQAIPLKAFEFKLVEKLLDLVKQVEKQYPEQATHWPAGAGSYHIDAQGEVTVWHYRALWRRSTDCAPDEVGWGSSQLVNATGMYYLPDGTPLQSRWRERGDGMKDIRVKVGRTIDENERVAVIHRHSLPSNHDLLSRDGLERNILLDSWKGLPLAIIIRVDRPMRLAGWWLGDVETDSQHFNEYDQLIVNGPPGSNNKPMLVTVGLPETDVQVEGEEREVGPVSVIRAVDNKATLTNGVTVEQPATIRVPEDYPTAYAAVKAAKAGDTIVISADRYRGEDILIEPKLEIEVEKTASNNSGGDSKRHQHVTFKEGMSIREALRFLGKAHKKNIILSDKVAGQVPVNELYNVTFEEALQAILGTHKYIIDGDFIRVYTEEEFESIYPEEKTNSQVEVEKPDVQVEGEKTISPKLVMLLGAINSCGAETELNIDSISITARNISIRGDTSGRTNTQKFLDAIKDNGLKISQLRLDARDNRDRFSIIVDLEKDWQKWWQQHKTDVHVGVENTISPKLVMLLGAINSCAAETNLNIDSISITTRNIEIKGDTSSRINSQKFLDAIKKNELEVLRLNLDTRNNRDKFSIIVEPKDNWQQHKTDVQVEAERLVGSKLMEDVHVIEGLMPTIKLALEGCLGKRPRLPRLLKKPGPGILKGIVRDTADTSYHRAYLFFVPVESWPGKPVFYYLAVVNESFEITGIPPGTYYLFAIEARNSDSIDAVGLPIDWPRTVMVDAGGKVTRVEIEMATFLSKNARLWNAQGFLRGVGHLNAENVRTEKLGPYGKVSDAKGRPVPYATVQVREFKPNRGAGEGIAAPDARTNEQGYYGLRPLDYPYHVGAMIYEPLMDTTGYRWRYMGRNKVFEGKQAINFKFSPWPSVKNGSGTIEGIVVDDNNNLIPSFIVDVRPAEPWPKVSETSELWYERWGLRSAFSRGQFALSDVPEGICNVRIMSHETSAARGVTLGQREITVPAGQTIHLEFQIEDWEKKRGQRTSVRFRRRVSKQTSGVKTDVQVEGEPGDESTESKGRKPTVKEPSEHPGRMKGVVVNSVTGEPIAGAYVGVGDFGDSSGSNYSRHRSQGFHDKTKTDEQGRFELDGLVFTDDHPYLKYHPLVVTHPDFVRHDEKVELLKDKPVPDVKVSLRPAAKIDVTVVDADGNPLKGHWLIRLEALDGRRFIPPGSDPHLSSFASNIWAHWPDLRAKMGASQGFTFAELDTGQYSIEAIRFHLVDNPTPQNIWQPTITYHGSIPSIEIQAGQAKQVQLPPQDHQTRLTITPPEFPEMLLDKLKRSSRMPLMCLISRSPELLLWDDVKIYHLEDQRLGRIDKKRFFRGFFLQGEPLTINNLPPGSYSLFAVAVYGEVAGCLIGARAELAKGDNVAVEIPWRQPTGPSMVGPNRAFDYPVKLEARDYSASELCEVLTAITQSNPRLIAESSIEDEKLRFGKGEMSIWGVLEKLYLDKGWRVDEGADKTLIIRPSVKNDVPVEVEGVAEAEIERLRETRARRAIAERRKGRIEFFGLDLTDAPRATKSADLSNLFEARPPGSKSYHRREDVDVVYAGLYGTVYYIPEKEIFYVQHDKLGSSTLTYYGPFDGDPQQVLRLETDPPVEGDGAEAVSGESEVTVSEDGPRITFESQVCDLGQVSPKTKHVCEFKFTNTGNALLKITRVSSSCACATSKLKKKEYAPGESGTLKVTYQSAAHAGRVKKYVVVYCNDKVNPKVKLTIKAEIVVKVAHEPKRLSLVLDKENAGCPAITLSSLNNQPFSITGFKSAGDSITAEFDSSVKETSLVIQPKVDMEKLRTGLKGNIEISLTHPECKKVTILYDTLAEFKVDPRVVYVRKAEPQKSVTKKVFIFSNYNEDVEVQSTSSKKGTVKVLTQEKVRNGCQLELEITPPVADIGKRVFTDVFTVNLKGGQELKMTCYGIYSKKPAETTEVPIPKTDAPGDVKGVGNNMETQPLSFGPAVTEYIRPIDTADESFIDFDTGKLIKTPKHRFLVFKFDKNDRSQIVAWAKKNGADAMVKWSRKGNRRDRLFGSSFMAYDMAIIDAEPDDWQNLRPEETVRLLSSTTHFLEDDLGRGTEKPETTHILKTREGGMGIIQVMRWSDEPEGIYIRYKMIRETPSDKTVQVGGLKGAS